MEISSTNTAVQETSKKADIKANSKFSKTEKTKTLTTKERFQKKYGLYEDKSHFLVAVTTPLFDTNNAEVLSDLLPGISDMGFQLVLRANASIKYKNVIESFIDDHAGLCALVPDEEYEEVFTAADVLITFSDENETQNCVHTALSSGVIPIVSSDFPNPTIENYNPNLESGNAFVYHKKSVWSVFAALVRAYENYRFPYDWKNICKTAAKSIQKPA